LAPGGKAHIGRHREDRAGAGADAVHCGDDRLRTGAHRLHQIAGHAREFQQARHVHFDQRSDDLVHVAAGAEIAARAAQHDHLDGRRQTSARNMSRSSA
jgi:hypothetical protein